MKVILEQEVKNLGKKGDVKEVADGYARNYLLPNKLAVPATTANISHAAQIKASEERKKEKQHEAALAMASKLSKVEITLRAKLGEGGRLFGSITGKDIADALLENHGIEIDKRKIDLKEAIKSLGDYSIAIKIHPKVSAKIAVHVIAE